MLAELGLKALMIERSILSRCPGVRQHHFWHCLCHFGYCLLQWKPMGWATRVILLFSWSNLVYLCCFWMKLVSRDIHEVFIHSDSLSRTYFFLKTIFLYASPFLRIRTVFAGTHLMIWIVQVVDDQTKSTLMCTLLSVSSRRWYTYTSRAALSSQWDWNSDEFNCSVVYRQHDDSIAHLVLARGFVKRLHGSMGELAGHSLPSIKKTRSESCYYFSQCWVSLTWLFQFLLSIGGQHSYVQLVLHSADPCFQNFWLTNFTRLIKRATSVLVLDVSRYSFGCSIPLYFCLT